MPMQMRDSVAGKRVEWKDAKTWSMKVQRAMKVWLRKAPVQLQLQPWHAAHPAASLAALPVAWPASFAD